MCHQDKKMFKDILQMKFLKLNFLKFILQSLFDIVVLFLMHCLIYIDMSYTQSRINKTTDFLTKVPKFSF